MDVRLIAATNRNLEELIQKNQFREDLFYRLNVIPIFLPPLRERREDIGKLVTHFITKFNLVHGKSVNGIAPPAMEALLKHHWPGNIRELENVIEHAFVIESSETISLGSLPSHIRGGGQGASYADEATEEGREALSGGGDFDDLLLDYKTHKEQFEKDFIIKALKTFNGRINQTAMHAKIPKKTLLRKLAKYNIRAEDYKE
jgi:DNA-binding NtrC family response regulator